LGRGRSLLRPVKEHCSNGALRSQLSPETELRNYARDHLAHFKCPQRIQFVSELPKTATGKVQKYVLRGKPAISKQ
jgi:acyl-coenzyme A synthetase/AMP-(fatty) acid ligase